LRLLGGGARAGEGRGAAPDEAFEERAERRPSLEGAVRDGLEGGGPAAGPLSAARSGRGRGAEGLFEAGGDSGGVGSSGEAEDEGVPRGFLCAITHELMRQPALLLSPQLPRAPTYERVRGAPCWCSWLVAGWLVQPCWCSVWCA
jgi:hypothetical protein